MSDENVHVLRDHDKAASFAERSDTSSALQSPGRGVAPPPVSAQAGLGEDFARALAIKDRARMRDLLHPEIDFRAMTPGRIWEAADPDAVIETFLATWFDDADEVEALERIESDAFADRLRVGYRLRVVNPDGRFLVEQQAYLGERDGRIGWMRVMCSGYRPDDAG